MTLILTKSPVARDTTPACPTEREPLSTDHRPPSTIPWSYEEAFCRNLGLISREEQQKLRNSRVAIAGMGGVGGVHLLTLARLGIGKFTIADPDTFELANFNRQVGATINELGQPKADSMAKQVRLINPEIDIRTLVEPIDHHNIEEFLDGADVFIDGVDFFAIDARRLLFAEARRRGIWALTAGPHAFGTACLTFSPTGMSFDTYFDMRDGMNQVDKLVAFSVGCVPSPIHLRYVSLSEYFQPHSGHAASLGLACQLATGVVATQVTKILLGRPNIRSAPWYFHFDPYRWDSKKGYLWFGNRNLKQRFKRWWLRRLMRRAARTGRDSKLLPTTRKSES